MAVWEGGLGRGQAEEAGARGSGGRDEAPEIIGSRAVGVEVSGGVGGRGDDPVETEGRYSEGGVAPDEGVGLEFDEAGRGSAWAGVGEAMCECGREGKRASMVGKARCCGARSRRRGRGERRETRDILFGERVRVFGVEWVALVNWEVVEVRVLRKDYDPYVTSCIGIERTNSRMPMELTEDARTTRLIPNSAAIHNALYDIDTFVLCTSCMPPSFSHSTIDFCLRCECDLRVEAVRSRWGSRARYAG